MGAMLHSMAATSVSVVLPQLQGSLSATPDQIAWVITPRSDRFGGGHSHLGLDGR